MEFVVVTRYDGRRDIVDRFSLCDRRLGDGFGGLGARPSTRGASSRVVR